MKMDPELRALIDGLAQQLSHDLTSLTQTTERLTNGIRNHVLEVGTRTFPTEGFIVREYGATVGSVVVHNFGESLVTVAAGLSAGVAPREGVGVYRISPGTWEAVNIGARAFTLYGTAGQVVSLQSLTVGTTGAGGLLAVDGGAP